MAEDIRRTELTDSSMFSQNPVASPIHSKGTLGKEILFVGTM